MSKRFMYLKIGVLLVFIVVNFVSNNSVGMAQTAISQKFTPTDIFKNNALSFSIYPLIYNGLSIQYERRIVNKHWIKLAPIYYSTIHYSTLRKTDIQYMRGFDLSLYHVYDYYKNQKKGFKLSLQYGFLYGQNDISTIGQTHTQIEKYGIDIMLNFRKMIGENFFFDFYVGYGNRWTNTRIENPIGKSNGSYNNFMFDYGYAGPVLDIGINIGLAF